MRDPCWPQSWYFVHPVEAWNEGNVEQMSPRKKKRSAAGEKAASRGKASSMPRKPTISDVAKVAGVSKSTVSLVVRNNPIVSENARTRVQEAMVQLGYVYNRGAANLRMASSSAIGVIVNDLTNGFFAELAVAMDMIVQSAGFVQLMANTCESIDRQREVIASMREHGVSGMIITPVHGTSAEDLRPLVDSGMPIVVAIRDIPGLHAIRVVPENRKGTSEAGRHLLGLGHRRLGFLGGFADTAVFQTRLQGLRDVLREAGIRLDDRYIVPSNASRAGGRDAMRKLLELPERPTACLCINDAVAFGACDGLRSAAIEPGRDFGVIGFDDVAEASCSVPALTTVSVDPQALGRRVAQLLLRQVSAGRVERELVTTPTRLVIRESCGAPWREATLRSGGPAGSGPRPMAGSGN
jgi:LacI family transcriptional regulator